MENLVLPISQFFDNRLTDKNDIHSYCPVYETILKSVMSKKKSITLLEIGIQRQGSVAAWTKCLPTSKIIGVDCQKPENSYKHPNYTEIICNAYSEKFFNIVNPGSIDVLVEDGSHSFQDLMFVCKYYPRLLTPGGILIIEDIPDMSWISELQSTLPPGWLAQVLDRRAIKNRWDDVMLVITKLV